MLNKIKGDVLTVALTLRDVAGILTLIQIVNLREVIEEERQVGAIIHSIITLGTAGALVGLMGTANALKLVGGNIHEAHQGFKDDYNLKQYLIAEGIEAIKEDVDDAFRYFGKAPLPEFKAQEA